MSIEKNLVVTIGDLNLCFKTKLHKQYKKKTFYVAINETKHFVINMEKNIIFEITSKLYLRDKNVSFYLIS